jgi:hypothetical protein
MVELEGIGGGRVQARAPPFSGVPLEHRRNGLPDAGAEPDHGLDWPGAPFHRHAHHHLRLLHQVIHPSNINELAKSTRRNREYIRGRGQLSIRTSEEELSLASEAADGERLKGESGSNTS